MAAELTKVEILRRLDELIAQVRAINAELGIATVPTRPALTLVRGGSVDG